MTQSSEILRVEGLSKRYKGLVATNDVSFSVKTNTITSVIGPNGAGKSTLFNLITGFTQPTSGEVYFEGRSLAGIVTHRRAELGIARAFQIARPFKDLTVFENVKVGALFGRRIPKDVEAVTQAALETTRMAHLANEQAANLTVGQLRHLEVARAVATRAKLLLADEPCAGLNPTETAAMIEVLRDVRATGVTVLLVEHDMPSVMDVSDHIIVLDAGTKIAEGTPCEITSNPRVIAAYLGSAEPV